MGGCGAPCGASAAVKKLEDEVTTKDVQLEQSRLERLKLEQSKKEESEERLRQLAHARREVVEVRAGFEMELEELEAHAKLSTDELFERLESCQRKSDDRI